MTSQHIRTFGLIVGLVGMLGLASIAAAAPLSDQQISRQIENRLSKNDALEHVTVSVQASVVSLIGTVPSLWAKTQAIAEARELEEVTTVVSDALDIESAESDGAIVEQIAKDIWRVSIPGPSAAARSGVSTAPGIAESTVPPGRFNRHGAGFGFGRGFGHPGSRFGADHHGLHDADGDLHGPASFDFSHHLRGVGPHGLGVGGQDQLQRELDHALYAHTGNSFYGIFDYVGGSVADGVVILTGAVTHEYKASKMAAFVSRVEGVKEIQNQIGVLPVSALDNRLRIELARNIYGNPLFWNYAIQRNPSVRIIVDNLHVTLAGIVISEVDKRVAADIVQQTAGVLTVRNNLEIKDQVRG